MQRFYSRKIDELLIGLVEEKRSLRAIISHLAQAVARVFSKRKGNKKEAKGIDGKGGLGDAKELHTPISSYLRELPSKSRLERWSESLVNRYGESKSHLVVYSLTQILFYLVAIVAILLLRKGGLL